MDYDLLHLQLTGVGRFVWPYTWTAQGKGYDRPVIASDPPYYTNPVAFDWVDRDIYPLYSFTGSKVMWTNALYGCIRKYL